MSEKSSLRLADSSVEHQLPDGRRVVLNWDGDEGEIGVRAPSGDLELQIRITPEGPVVQLTGARLELNATDSVSIQTRNLDLHAAERASLTSDDAIELRSAGDTDLNAHGEVRVLASMIHLN